MLIYSPNAESDRDPCLRKGGRKWIDLSAREEENDLIRSTLMSPFKLLPNCSGAGCYGVRLIHGTCMVILSSLINIIIISPSMRMVNASPTLSKCSAVHRHAPIEKFCLRGWFPCLRKKDDWIEIKALVLSRRRNVCGDDSGRDMTAAEADLTNWM